MLMKKKGGKSGDHPGCGTAESDEKLKKMLTPQQYRVVRENATEPPFKNAYWDNKRQGLYVDITTGDPLFGSQDKFDSGTGWPSFTKPVSREKIVEKKDSAHGLSRVEVRTKGSDLHLGHVFDDGPQPERRRYCINSAAMRFIPVEYLEKEGYGAYLHLFEIKEGAQPAEQLAPSKRETATFGAGCFWGAEAAFREVKGVVATAVGYMGGALVNPTYEDVTTDKTGHAEVVHVEYDPAQVSYERILDVFWNIHDPTTPNRQGPDVGSQYRSVIFFHMPEQEIAARRSREMLERSGKVRGRVVTEIAPAKTFYRAEEYHQRYYEKAGVKPSCRLPR